MMAGVFRKADRRHKDQLVNRAKMLHSSTRALVGMAKAIAERPGKWHRSARRHRADNRLGTHQF
jgi:hypothetical protein